MKNEQIVKYFQKYSICMMSLKTLTQTIESLYIRGDEISLKEIIKNEINCIPKEHFRYLLLFIADYETKMKIYYYCLKGGRLDLLKEIKGLRSKDLQKILEKFKDEENRNLIIKDLNKVLRKEKDIKEEEKRIKSLKKTYKKISSILYK